MYERVAVRLPNWLGDTVMAVPTVRALRAALPGATLLVGGPWAGVLGGQGLADVLVSYPRAWPGRLRAADAVRRCAPELAVVLPNSFESAAAALYWGARRRVGYRAGGRGVLLTDALPLPVPRAHQAEEYQGLLGPLGVAPSETTPHLGPPDPHGPARTRVRALLADAGLAEGKGRRVAVHLGAAYGAAKVWPLEQTAEFCRLARARGQQPVLLGAPADAAAAASVVAASGAASLVGRDGPELLPALLVEVDAVVCGDTGVGHLAAALGTPVVALFGPTDPTLTAPRGRVAVLQGRAPCAPCFYRECPIEHPCLRSLAPREVHGHLDALLGGAA
jgi:heptosyltransferase-2